MNLPIGDGKISITGPKIGYVYMKTFPLGMQGAFKEGEWINSDGTFDATKKVIMV
jgi:hypothetical protein